MSRYVASICSKWEDFTDKHKMIREEIENKIKRFLKGEKQNPIAIRGPIGQGKTQLLYHVFTFTWKNGGIAFYTTLDRLLPDTDTTASTFAEKIDLLISESIKKLNSGELNQIQFFTEEMRDFVKSLDKGSLKQDKVVFLIDEMERSYEKLLNKVRTDDRSPLGYWLEHTPHFPIAAFAPLSHYEALYGHAERRRWDSITLPPITATALREKGGDLGNFVWWVSRGRLGISYKALDSVKRKKFVEYKDFKDLVDELGPIAEVPAMDPDATAKLLKVYNFIVRLFPHDSQEQTTLPSVIKGKVVDRVKFIEIVKKSLAKEGWEERSIEFFTYYLNMIIDALSRENEFLVPLEEYDELLPLFKLSIDLAIEHETLENEDVKKINEKFRELEGKFASFFFTKIYQELRGIERREGSILSYKELSNIFPMPITSPVFGGIESPDKAREILLSKSIYDYVGKDEIETSKGIMTFLYFLNEAKLERYLNSLEIKDFLPPHKGLVCILLSGDPKQVKLTGIAEWLKNVMRLEIVAPSKLLCDFITYFITWAFKHGIIISGYVDDLRKLLDAQAKELWTKDKESSRKISHYANMLGAFLNSFVGLLDLDKEKYSAKISRVDVARYGSRYTRFPDLLGLAFIKNKDEQNLIYRFRKILSSSEELKGLRSGISGLLEDASVTRTGKLSNVLENICKDFENQLHFLLALAHLKEIQEDDFTTLSEQSEAKIILKGIFKFARCEVSPSRVEEVKRKAEKVLEDIENLKQARQNIMEIIGIKIRESNSEKNLSQIREICQIISDANSASKFIRWLLTDFSDAILEDFKNQYLHNDQTIRSLWEKKCNIARNFESEKVNIENLKPQVFEWIGRRKEDVLSELESEYKKSLKTLTGYYGAVDWEKIKELEWSAFEEEVGNLIDQIKGLEDLNEELTKTIRIANEINAKLRLIQNETF